MQPYSVSYLVIGGYIGFVVVATLLVGLLPALVNLPYCDSKEPAADPLPLQHEVAIGKRSFDERQVVSSTLFEERKKRGLEAYENEMKNNPVFRRVAGARVPITELKECPELQAPLPGVEYPWYEERLPDYIRPVNYNIEILLNDLGIAFYDGFINITFTVNQPDQSYILLHNGVGDHPNIVKFVDNNGNPVELACIGNFPYLRNDYYIIKTDQPLNPALGPFTVEFLFLDFYSGVDSGIYRQDYDDSEGNPSTMFLSKFRPIDARRAYPCFDEPGFRATYDVTIYHRIDYGVAFNTKVKDSFVDPLLPTIQTTIFETTPPMPSDYLAYTVFQLSDFSSITKNTPNGNIPITIWARKQYVDAGFASDPLDMFVNIFNQFLDIFRTAPETFPDKIDILVVPEYPVAGIGHFGLPIIREDKALFKEASASERDKLNTALTIGRLFAEFWFGNYISHNWWDQLWTQEGFAEYVKYRAIDQAYPSWNLLEQFVVNEVVETIISDGYPSSHPIQKPINNPYEIEEYFDNIETSKTAAILHMLENEFTWAAMETAIMTYVKATPWNTADIQAFYSALGPIGPKNWSVKDFMDRWTIQANYPLVNVEIIENGDNTQSIKVTQTRALNTNESLFAGELLYPSPWDFVWFIPIECSFGDGTGQSTQNAEREVYLDQREDVFPLPTRAKWTWVHCDRVFRGYYELQYTEQNWRTLGQALKGGNLEILSEDRAQIIHNLFLNSYTERISYYLLREVLEYLPTERDYVPWRTVYLHLDRLASILTYRKAFFELSQFFAYQVRSIELNLDIWQPADTHIEELLKETIIHIACQMQDPFCLANVTNLWPTALTILQTGNFENAAIPAFARKFVYEYHMENTYDVSDWDLLYRDYSGTLDENEQRRMITALSYSRLPWLLYRFLNGPIKAENDYMKAPDFFDIAYTLAPRPLGRELVWDLFRAGFNDLLEDYGEDDPRIGWLLIEITQTFETEFLFYELLSFVFFTTTGATSNARFKALELVSTNLLWLQDKEKEIQCAFSLVGSCLGGKHEIEIESERVPFATSAREAFLRNLKETDLPMFREIKKKLLL